MIRIRKIPIKIKAKGLKGLSDLMYMTLVLNLLLFHGVKSLHFL